MFIYIYICVYIILFFQEFKFKLFHYLLYSQKEQNKQSVLIKGDKNGMFMKLGSRAGVFHQKAYIPFSKDEEVMLQWRMNFTNFMDPDLTFYCTSTPALPMPNACLPSTMKHMCSKFA